MNQKTEPITLEAHDRKGKRRQVVVRALAVEGGSIAMNAGLGRGDMWYPASREDAERLRDHFQACVDLWEMPDKGERRTNRHKCEAWHPSNQLGGD